MEKDNLKIAMAAALKAASVYSLELDALLLELKKSGESELELGIKICEAEGNWMLEMENHSVAFKKFHSIDHA